VRSNRGHVAHHRVNARKDLIFIHCRGDLLKAKRVERHTATSTNAKACGRVVGFDPVLFASCQPAG
jgi:hypothetical protein